MAPRIIHESDDGENRHFVVQRDSGKITTFIVPSTSATGEDPASYAEKARQEVLAQAAELDVDEAERASRTPQA